MIRYDLRDAYSLLRDILCYKGDIYCNEDLRELIADMQLEDVFSKEYIMQNNIQLPLLFQEIKEYLWGYFLMNCGKCGNVLTLEEYDHEECWEDIGIVCASCVGYEKYRAERD